MLVNNGARQVFAQLLCDKAPHKFTCVVCNSLRESLFGLRALSSNVLGKTCV